jgi:glycosyltransferase involved in cell wall biosynthesis
VVPTEWQTMHIVRVLAKLEPGGAQLAVLRLSQELERRHGVTTELLVGDATPQGMALAKAHGVPTVAYRLRESIHPTRNLQWRRSGRFATWLSDRLTGADVVHAHMVGAWWATAQVIGSTPFVASEHNEVNWSPRRVRSMRGAAARVDRFFGMGPAARAFLVAAGARPGAVIQARSPVAGLSALPSPDLPPRITFTGRFCADKGADVLIEALALTDFGERTVYLLGDGPMRGQLVSAIERHGLCGRVVVPGWVDEPWTFVAGSDLHVVPSREEAWSQSAVLALGLGVPVLGTAVDGLVDTLAQGRGITVPADDPQALSCAMSDMLAGRRTTDTEAARAYARQFTPARVADFYFTEYATLLASRRHDPLPVLVQSAQSPVQAGGFAPLPTA